MSKSKSQTGHVLDLMEKLRAGESFYTDASQSTVTTYASKKGIKVSTQKILVIEDHMSNNPKVKYIIKVTML